MHRHICEQDNIDYCSSHEHVLLGREVLEDVALWRRQHGEGGSEVEVLVDAIVVVREG